MGKSDGTCRDDTHPQITVLGLKSIVCFFNLALDKSLTIEEFQSLPDWVDTLNKADTLLKSRTNNHSADNGLIPSTALSADQLKSRELYLYSERSERTSELSQIYANVGFACLAIRRLLAVCLISCFFVVFSYPMALGSLGPSSGFK